MAFVTPGRAGLSGNLPLSPRERLFHLKIIECGKCWIWKLFIGFPFLFLPPAGPAVASRAGRLCSGFRANWAGASGFPADEPRAAGAAIVVKGPPRVRALRREAGLADWRWRPSGCTTERSGCAAVPIAPVIPHCSSRGAYGPPLPRALSLPLNPLHPPSVLGLPSSHLHPPHLPGTMQTPSNQS